MSDLKYVGIDVHKATCVIIVLNALGQFDKQVIIKTTADALRDFFRGQGGTLHVIFEEGTQSNWLYELIKPLVAEVVVCDVRRHKSLPAGNHADASDAEQLAQLLRLGAAKSVYKGDTRQRQLKELARAYDNLVSDATRTSNRLKAIYRARGIDCDGRDIYKASRREHWLEKLTDPAARFRAQCLFAERETIQKLRKAARQELIKQSRRHPDYELLLKTPSFGPVRVAQLLAWVGTPHRFRTKRQFWPYCGLAVRTHSSAEYQIVGGRVEKRRRAAATRGLNPHHCPGLKLLFKGAALRALSCEPFRVYYQGLLGKGMRPEMARLSLARKLAATVLVTWQRQEAFDPAKVS
jgi:transposase